MENHARKFGLEIEYEEVEEIYKEGDEVVVKGQLAEYRAPAAIVTAGGQPRKLGIPGEEEFAGRGVSYCAICDGARSSKGQGRGRRRRWRQRAPGKVHFPDATPAR